MSQCTLLLRLELGSTARDDDDDDDNDSESADNDDEDDNSSDADDDEDEEDEDDNNDDEDDDDSNVVLMGDARASTASVPVNTAPGPISSSGPESTLAPAGPSASVSGSGSESSSGTAVGGLLVVPTAGAFVLLLESVNAETSTLLPALARLGCMWSLWARDATH